MSNFSCLCFIVFLWDVFRIQIFLSTHLIKITITLALIQLENSFWAHLKGNEIHFPGRCHMPRFNVDHQGHQCWSLNCSKAVSVQIFRKNVSF